MTNCYTCGKSIQNVHHLDGKSYGYNCYRQALALKYVHLQNIANADWSHKCIALIEVFKTKTFKDDWNKRFQDSIVAQWDDCHKLTGNQFAAIHKKFNEVETWEYELTYMVIGNGSEKSIERIRSLYGGGAFNKEKLYENFHNDERLIDFLKIGNKHLIKYIKNNTRRKESALSRIDRFLICWTSYEGRKVWDVVNESRMNEMIADAEEYEIVIHKSVELDLLADCTA
ncbi:hypothetical protein EBB07_29360 [Paenibacillaceae bacterium]|nr:hypothetical protein EBB07_29360 [Paenibacillaceae bacterium]